MGYRLWLWNFKLCEGSFPALLLWLCVTNPCSQLSQQPMQTKLHLSTTSRYTNTNTTSEHIHHVQCSGVRVWQVSTVLSRAGCQVQGCAPHDPALTPHTASPVPGSWIYKCCVLCSVISFPCSGLGCTMWRVRCQVLLWCLAWPPTGGHEQVLSVMTLHWLLHCCTEMWEPNITTSPLQHDCSLIWSDILICFQPLLHFYLAGSLTPAAWSWTW